MKEGSGNGVSISMGLLGWEPERRAALLEILKDTKRKAQEASIYLHKGPFGNLEGGLFTRL
jgi:hypothetical protein